MDGKINGRPTKEFFVNMITRDITIKDSILDLLDNSIDGATNINEYDFSDLYIKINIDKNGFRIEDNCGGFDLETAKKYAFRFGRPSEHHVDKQSVGRFGVGMKRALFKIGKSFEVETKTDDNHFEVKVNVDEWKDTSNKTSEDNDDWSFTYDQINEETKNLEVSGTYIEVKDLYQEVSDQFEDPKFKDALHNDIEKVLTFSLSKGLKIFLNDNLMKSRDIQIFNDKTKPIKIFKQHEEVRYRVFAGLGDTGKPEKAGWYIFCNDRLVLEANTNEITSWGLGSNPKFTNAYAMFRGVIFINSDETINLPLTTTKKGVDTSSPSYRYILPFIKDSLWKVTSFLKKVKKLDNPNEYRKEVGEMEEIKLGIQEMRAFDISEDSTPKFEPPQLDYDKLITKGADVRIGFYVKSDLAELLKEKLEVKSYKAIGEEILDYYLKMEEIDYE